MIKRKKKTMFARQYRANYNIDNDLALEWAWLLQKDACSTIVAPVVLLLLKIMKEKRT